MINYLLSKYPAGWVEVMGSVSVQVAYLLFGLCLECLRSPYKTSTSPKMIIQSLRNHLIATVIHVAFETWKAGGSVLTRTFILPFTPPSIHEIIRDLTIGLLMRNVMFWAIHRLWHIPGIFKWVHAKHHEVKYPGNYHLWTISYMTVVDFVFLYGLPVITVAKTLEMNIITTLLFAFISAVGEQMKLVWGDKAHDEHHQNGTVNLGCYGVMDKIFRTSSL